MNDVPEELKTYLLNRYKNSSYANFLQMHMLDLHDGEITISMQVRHELTNLSRILHGGAVGSLLDMAMNLACFSTGSKATILGFNANFLRGCKEGRTVRAVGKVLHRGKRTMVVESNVFDPEDRLLARGRGTFLVNGPYTPEDFRRETESLSPEPEAQQEGESLRAAPPAAKSIPGWLGDLLLNVHDNNFFARHLGMGIYELSERHCLVAMPVTKKHINIRGVVHGGALVSLADMSMMVACATLGKRTVTLELNINFVRRVRVGTIVASSSQVIHKGKTAMVVRSSIQDEGGRLLAEARGTFFVTGEYSPEELAEAAPAL